MGCTQEALGGVAQGLHMGCGGLWGAAGGSVRGERDPPHLAAEWGGGVLPFPVQTRQGTAVLPSAWVRSLPL